MFDTRAFDFHINRNRNNVQPKNFSLNVILKKITARGAVQFFDFCSRDRLLRSSEIICCARFYFNTAESFRFARMKRDNVQFPVSGAEISQNYGVAAFLKKLAREVFAVRAKPFTVFFHSI